MGYQRRVHGDRSLNSERISFLSLVKNCNHKGLGIYYLLSAFIFGISGTLISVLIRIELYSSGNRIISPENQNFYNISITLHGFLMIFFSSLFVVSVMTHRMKNYNKIPFFPFIYQKDFFGLILILCLYLLQTHFGISSFSHPDNALEVCGLLTPLHIVPEWYFLCQYAMLKAVPNKNAGFIILLTSILIFFIFGEIRNLTALCLLNNNGFSLSSFFLSFLSFLWIGAQFPQEKFLSYGRILTLHYYFLLLNLGLGKFSSCKRWIC